MQYIKRTVEKRIKKLVKHFPVIFITGPRQSGKTTMIKHLFPSYTYYNLETPATLQRAIADPVQFLSPSRLILDEAQEAPFLFSYLLEIVDSNPEKSVIISGSQNLLLNDKITQSLAGRVAIVELYPLTIQEIKRDKSFSADIDQMILRGLYPKVFLQKELQAYEWHNSYIHTYLQRDVRSLKNIHDLTSFTTFLTLLAGQIGSILNLESISNTLGISSTTLKGWLSILENLYIVYRLPPYYTNIRKRLIKRSKIYFWDTGIAATLLNIRTPKQLITHPLYGNLLENFVVSEIKKHLKHVYGEIPMYFLRDKTGHEIDLIVEASPHLHAIEIKSSATFSNSFIKNLEFFAKMINFASLNIIYKGPSFKLKNINITKWSEWEQIPLFPESAEDES